MKYIGIRLDFDYEEKRRFKRVVLVRDNPDLEVFGKYLIFALGGVLEHCCLFKVDNISYVPDDWIEDKRTEKSLNLYYLSDLKTEFKLVYDTGENWEFNLLNFSSKLN